MSLKTTYKDDVFNGNRKYNQTNNPDSTISLTDVTDYVVQGDTFSAADINATNIEVNRQEEVKADKDWATETFSNPNLLNDPDFSVYKEFGFTPWFLDPSATITHAEEGIIENALSTTYNTLYLADEYIENVQYPLIVTISVDDVIYKKVLNDDEYANFSSKYYIHWLKSSDSRRGFRFGRMTNITGDINWKWFKLEYGNVSTKFIKPKLTEELQNCLMYNESGDVQVPYYGDNLGLNPYFKIWNYPEIFNTPIGQQSIGPDGWSTYRSATIEKVENGIKITPLGLSPDVYADLRLDFSNIKIGDTVTLVINLLEYTGELPKVYTFGSTTLILKEGINVITRQIISEYVHIPIRCLAGSTMTLGSVHYFKSPVAPKIKENENTLAGSVLLSDPNNNFDSNNVEGALAELGDRGAPVEEFTVVNGTDILEGVITGYRQGRVVTLIGALTTIEVSDRFFEVGNVPVGFRPIRSIECLQLSNAAQATGTTIVNSGSGDLVWFGSNGNRLNVNCTYICEEV